MVRGRGTSIESIRRCGDVGTRSPARLPPTTYVFANRDADIAFRDKVLPQCIGARCVYRHTTYGEGVSRPSQRDSVNSA